MNREEIIAKVLKEVNKVPAHKIDSDYIFEIAVRLGCQANYGATRLVLIFPKHGWVIKMPYGRHDYCAQEVRSYRTAVEYGVEKLLLSIEKVAETVHGIPLYIQPMYRTSVNDMNCHDRNKIQQLCQKTTSRYTIAKIRQGCYCGPETNWVSRATQLYGKKFMRSFEKWTKEFRVNDLHNANIGYIDGYRPVLVDYAGYDNF